MSNILSTTSYLVYTDLDGTLLDHDTYSFEDAKSTMKKLVRNGHFIIPNTSKTYAELESFQNSAGLNTPFIFENGAAVAIPKDFFPCQPPETEDMGDVWLKSFTKKREYWLDLISKHGQHFIDDFKGFSSMSVDDVVALTGLTSEAAEMAMQRRFGEPLHWSGDEYAKREFLNIMQSAGATVLQGGRFVHICGETDKGQAMLWLSAIFEQECQEQKFRSIALGDSGNDIAMLEASDIAVQIKSPTHQFPTINKTSHLHRSTLCGPAGWSECLEKIVFNQE